VRLIVIVVVIFISKELFAQKQVNNWYFGHEAGLTFNSGTAESITNGKLTSIEGSAVMSDANGSLLFYTNSQTIWNQNHAIMAGGNYIDGNESAVQSSVIVPLPGSTTRYYVFTNGYNGEYSFNYSVVDMQLNGGLGGVVAAEKNIRLSGSGTESLAATKHCNNQDYWIITRVSSSQLTFDARLLCASGISKTVTSTFSIPTELYDDVAYVKFSTDGKLMAAVSFGTDAYIFDFNKSTGELSLKLTIPTLSAFYEMNYTAAFSPDKTKLYLSSWENDPFPASNNCNIEQYDLTAADVPASRVVLNTVDFSFGSPNGYGFTGTMQLGPDQKIYVSRWKQTGDRIHPDAFYTLDSLDVIQNPNAKGIAANYKRNQVWLKGKPTMIGLPNFVESYLDQSLPPPFYITAGFAADAVCFGQATTFHDLSTSSCEIDSWEWNFDDAGSGAENTSTLKDPTHLFTSPGIHNVTLKVSSGCQSGIIIRQVNVNTLDINLGPDVQLCGDGKLVLQTNTPFDFFWQDGSTNPMLLVDAPGIYWLEANDGVCHFRDSVVVTLKDVPVFSLGNDTTICEGRTLLLDPGIQEPAYRWINGNNSQTLSASAPGIYWVEAGTETCYFRDSIEVSMMILPKLKLPSDTTLCLGDLLELDVSYPGMSYQWSHGPTSGNVSISEGGVYEVQYGVEDPGCYNNLTIDVIPNECLDDIFIPNIITPLISDNKNDTFIIDNAGPVLFHLVIYNRYGKQVAEFENYQHDWQGEGLPSGVYYYRLTSNFSGREFKGWVMVVR
jgi:gliding motility-associated-like protein